MDEPIKGRPGVDDDAKAIALRPRNFEELWNFASLICKTNFVPAQFKGDAGAVLAAVQYGNEVGLPPMQSLRWIAVINGTPSIWGDGYWMLVKSHPACEWTKELSPDEALAKGYGECTIKRRGDPEPTTRRFTLEMATTAGLVQRSGDKGPWAAYRGRMLQQRARHLCGSDAIPEATGGLTPKETAEDYDIETTGQALAREPIPPPRAIGEDNASKAPKQTKSDELDSTSATLGKATTSERPRARKSPDQQPVSPQKPKEEITATDKLTMWLDMCDAGGHDEEVFNIKNVFAQHINEVPQKEQIPLIKRYQKTRQMARERIEAAKTNAQA